MHSSIEGNSLTRRDSFLKGPDKNVQVQMGVPSVCYEEHLRLAPYRETADGMLLSWR